MIESADGRTTIDGSSSGLGHPVDTALLRELRAAAEVILVGAGTLITEAYGGLLDAQQRAQRVAAGRSPHPTVATISRKGGLPDVPIAHEDVPFVVYEEKTVEAVLADIGPAAILCEGGPKLLRQLAAADLLDDVVLTVAPLLVGGLANGLLTGEPLPEPLDLRLVDVARAGDHLFLHYSR